MRVRKGSSIGQRVRAAANPAALFWAAAAAAHAGGIVPQPTRVQLGNREKELEATTAIRVPPGDKEAAFAADYLSSLWRQSNHLDLKVDRTASAQAPTIAFRREKGLQPEGYRLRITSAGATISASAGAGLLYGAISLWQLSPPDVARPHVPVQMIDDAPRFAWRGLMLDSSRHFQSPELIRSMIDWMAWHKLNVLHWHLTDDQGWRLQIRRYPKLTSVGAWRDQGAYGGFYTQAEVRDIVAFASNRHITVVPEIDMPGHATAAIAAYPELGSSPQPLVVSSSWGVHQHLFNLKPGTFQFLENVLREVMELFPSRYIHIGGDEAVKNEWNASPEIQAQAAALGLHGSDALQTYFTQKMSRFLTAHGRRPIGWDEVLTPGLPPEALVMSWRGVSGAHDAAVAGNDTVLSPQPTLYFDYRQSVLTEEPTGRLTLSTTQGVYNFEPADATLTAAQRLHVLGVQGNIWTEHIRNDEALQWMALPRAAALAEVAWSAHRDWPGFVERLAPLFGRYRSMGLNYADSVFGLDVRTTRSVDGVSVALANTDELLGIAGVSIRYTLDGSDPRAASAAYRTPILTPVGSELRAATFLGDTEVSRVLRQPIDMHSGVRRSSLELEVCTNGVGLLLEPRTAKGGSARPIAIDIMHPCWMDRGVDLSRAPRISAGVAKLPFNYELAGAEAQIQVGDNTSPVGELEVRVDRCDAPVLLRLPLAAAEGASGVVPLPAQQLPALPGRHDLCLTFARPKLDPMWGLDWVEITEVAVMALEIVAPFDGWCTSLDEVPDPVFAGRMLGDGLAVDPLSGRLLAPCNGVIIGLPASGHAISLRAAEGIEILIHIGIDTVALQGRGFEPRVTQGATVSAGDELIRFDLDALARAAKSLITPILVQSEGAPLATRRGAGLVRAGELLFTVAGGALVSERPAAGSIAAIRRSLSMPLKQGMHARPAALIAQRAKSAQAHVTLSAHGRSANARSIVALMALGVRHGDEVWIEASGMDAAPAVEGVIAGIEEALRMESASHPGESAGAVANSSAVAVADTPSESGVLRGITAVPGFAVGRATRIERRTLDVIETAPSASQEAAELARAHAEVRTRLQRLAATGSATRREIIKAHLEFLDDPQLNEVAAQCIASGKSAGFAWRSAVQQSIRILEGLDDPRLRERADDLLDIEAHVLMALAGEARPMILPLPEHAVLIAADLLPSELTALERTRLAGICLSAGGATSHVAILAAAMEIPMLVGLGGGLRDIADGAMLVMDADQGRLETTPSASAMAKAQSKVEARLVRSAELRAAAHADCYARDGTRVEVFANLGNVTEAAVAVDNGAEGCGLLRTEFLFIDRDAAPTEEEQFQSYQEIANALSGRPLILRLMDVGGDKPLQYLPLPHEDNPALGLRGVRTLLARPDLMRDQLRAALRVQPYGKLRLLIPMVTETAEIVALREACDRLREELGIRDRIDIGAMIETPAAALTAASLLREVDFLSIGSNDLTQYTLAMDRGHATLAARTDALHPSVLKLIAAAAAAGGAAGKLVAVCGGVAADLAAVPILLGLGVRELSVVPSAVPAIKQRVSALAILECRELALRCMELGSAAEVRALIGETL